jgi:hypothetical protein
MTHEEQMLEAVRSKFPPGLVPETFELLHAYYTPTILADGIADAVCQLLPVQAPEPSTGIGRLVDAFSGKRWIADAGSRQQGTFNLIVSNPPYGERGAAALGAEAANGFESTVQKLLAARKGSP